MRIFAMVMMTDMVGVYLSVPNILYSTMVCYEQMLCGVVGGE